MKLKLENKNQRTDRKDVMLDGERLGTLDQWKGGWTLTPNWLGDEKGLLEQDFKNLTEAKKELQEKLQ